MSAFAAQTLINAGQLQFDELDLHRTSIVVPIHSKSDCVNASIIRPEGVQCAAQDLRSCHRRLVCHILDSNALVRRDRADILVR